MNKFKYSENIIAEFEQALINAGMTDDNSDKPKFYRGSIPSENSDKLIMRYVVTDRNGNYADNVCNTITVYINATLFINSSAGFSDIDYQNLINAIEEQTKLKGFEISYGLEYSEVQTDNDSIIYSIQLEFVKRA